MGGLAQANADNIPILVLPEGKRVLIDAHAGAVDSLVPAKFV